MNQKVLVEWPVRHPRAGANDQNESVEAAQTIKFLLI